MPAFEWVHVQLHQQKGMISLSPPTICNSALHITAGDFGALKARLESLGFATQDVQELKTVLDSEPAPKEPGRVLPKVYAWIGKAGERLLDAGLDKAAPLAIEAITKYLGP
ncbi:hypothetical protein [Escherichia coli]|uniref:hypothetical protein n=1 Tax=Escherichia coli TaxID=562 RepID=UPI003F65AE35